MNYSSIIELLVEQYHDEAAAAETFYNIGDDLFMIHVHKRAAIYEALMRIADYDEDLVIDWINA